MKQLFFGTGNPNKLREIRGILGDSFVIRSFEDVSGLEEVDETETTIIGNAKLKAKGYFTQTGMACFSDDSGLEVDYLDGAPGVYSAMYAGPECSYSANVDKLLRELTGVEGRSARFITVIAYYDGSDMHTFAGVMEGTIIEERRGDNGFGYDPVFLPNGYEETYAEMDPAFKNRISHRGKAVQAFADFLKQQS